MNIGIYGGSFNPIHFGHLTVARKALEELKLDKLIVIPANVSPFKTVPRCVPPAAGNSGLGDAAGETHRGTEDNAAGRGTEFPWDRLELVKAAFADDPRVVVDDRELKRGGVSYTIDTVREIKEEYAPLSTSTSSLHLYFIIGEDSVEGLPKWKDIDELKKLVTFKAYPRTKESSTEIRELFAKNGVTLNPDAKLAAMVRQGVVRKNAFCPCRLQKLPEFFCPCDEFKGQLRDPNYHGLCHCRLYLKP